MNQPIFITGEIMFNKKEWQFENKKQSNINSKEWYKRNKDKVKEYCAKPEIKRKRKDYNLKRNYGITIEVFEHMYKEQEGICLICHEPFSFDKLVVDHDHETGKVRGLLCISCNRAIGFLKDSILITESAVEYLKKHS